MIERASEGDIPVLAKLAQRLWPEHALAKLEAEFAEAMAGEGACFVSYDRSDPVGFAQCQIRHDYVEGTRTSPVGYLEGIYVDAAYRREGRARRLLRSCEQWAASMGCTEFGSDCELENEASAAFHRACGFAEAARIVCFAKRLR